MKIIICRLDKFLMIKIIYLHILISINYAKFKFNACNLIIQFGIVQGLSKYLNLLIINYKFAEFVKVKTLIY